MFHVKHADRLFYVATARIWGWAVGIEWLDGWVDIGTCPVFSGMFHVKHVRRLSTKYVKGGRWRCFT
ncbi:hypothetical protein ASD71_16540 [Achromobacter sp. Root565]|nr:hypothetical protein ASD71_16540 [Achromobacter sp. Root565]